MKTCACGGDLLRHGLTRYNADKRVVGVRYKCRECGKTHTQRMAEDECNGLLFFSATGRPTLNDWRYAQ